MRIGGRARQPRGVRTGGQFAAEQRGESDVDLGGSGRRERPWAGVARAFNRAVAAPGAPFTPRAPSGGYSAYAVTDAAQLRQGQRMRLGDGTHADVLGAPRQVEGRLTVRVRDERQVERDVPFSPGAQVAVVDASR